jgi:hypothetical protein
VNRSYTTPWEIHVAVFLLYLIGSFQDQRTFGVIGSC